MILPDEMVEESMLETDSVYSKKARARLLENGEMSNEEEGFMEGYSEDDKNERH